MGIGVEIFDHCAVLDIIAALFFLEFDNGPTVAQSLQRCCLGRKNQSNFFCNRIYWGYKIALKIWLEPIKRLLN